MSRATKRANSVTFIPRSKRLLGRGSRVGGLEAEEKGKLEVPPQLCQKIGKVDKFESCQRGWIGQDADQHWECVEIAQLVEQRIRNVLNILIVSGLRYCC